MIRQIFLGILYRAILREQAIGAFYGFGTTHERLRHGRDCSEALGDILRAMEFA